MKRLASGILCIAIVLCTLVFTPIKADATTSGITGSCTWSLEGTILTISGSGQMAPYYTRGYLTDAPWGNEVTHVIIENGVTNVGQYAFYGCSKLQSVTLPSSVKKIDTQAFDRSGVSSIKFSEGLTTIYDGAFNSCTSLCSVVLPESLTYIGDWAFQSCPITSIVFSTNLKYIGNSAFNYGSIVDVWYLGNQSDKAEMTIKGYNACLNTATWHYDSCPIGAPHSYDNECDVNCNGCGLLRSVPEHIYDNACDSACNVCGKIRDIAHQYDDACDEKCNICQEERVASHSYDDGRVTQNATCGVFGIKTFTCTACGTTKTETLEKLTTHTYDHDCDTDCDVCGETRTITHQYKTTWSKDKSDHWYECSVCKDKKDVKTHTPGAAATEYNPQTCTTCGYVIQPALGHKHKHASKWTSDEKGHWYACSGCEEKGSYADHNFENACDRECSICGYTREIEHVFAEKWTTDEKSHWHVCTGCGLKRDEAVHEPGTEATATTAQTCYICDYEIAPALGVSEETGVVNDESVDAPVTETTTLTTKTDKPIDRVKSGILWWIIFSALSCVAIAVVVVVLIKRKKK